MVPAEVVPPAPPSDGSGSQFASEAEEPSSTTEPRAEPEAESSFSSQSVDDGPAAGVVEIDGDVSRLRSADKMMLGASDSTSVEQYRRLAARLLLAQAENGTKLVMITSALPSEGKTLTSANLALTLSESYKRTVLLIDGDLRRPGIHELFEIPNASGLNDGLSVDANRKIPLLSYTEHLSILTAGRPDSDPMSVLSGSAVRRVLEEAARRFQFVIIDTPPVALLPDAHLLSNLVDAVLLVVESGRSPLPALKRAVDAVGRGRVLGVVLNRSDKGLPHGNYYYYSRYGRYDDRRELRT